MKVAKKGPNATTTSLRKSSVARDAGENPGDGAGDQIGG
jgi:hypothetical protein